MSKKYFFLLLSAFLLVQCSDGKALTPSDGSVESTTTKIMQANSDSPAAKKLGELFAFVLSELERIVDSSLKTGQEVLKGFVTEASENANKSEKVTQRIEEFSKIAEQIEALKQNPEKLSEVEHVYEVRQKTKGLVEMSILLDKSGASTDDKLISDMLIKNGSEELAKEYGRSLTEFSKTLIQKADHFWNSLSSEEQQDYVGFAKWYQNYKEANDLENKIPLFKVFLEILQ